MACPNSSSSDDPGDTLSPFEGMQRVINNINVTGFPYDLFDFRITPSSNFSTSAQNAHEATEEQNILKRFELSTQNYPASPLCPFSLLSSTDYSSSGRVDSLSPASVSSEIYNTSTTSGEYSIPTENEDDENLPDILKHVETFTCNLSRSFANIPKEPQISSCLLKSSNIGETILSRLHYRGKGVNISYPKPLTEQAVAARTPTKKRASLDERKVAQFVHGLVLDKYGKSCKNVLEKLRKMDVPVKENKFQKVKAKFKTMLEKKNDNTKGSKILKDIIALPSMHTSTETELEMGIEQTNATGSSIRAFHEDDSSKSEDPIPEIIYTETQYTSSKLDDINGRMPQPMCHEDIEQDYQLPRTASIDTDNVSILLSSKSTLSSLKRRKHKYRKSRTNIITKSYYERVPLICSSTEIQIFLNTSATPDLINDTLTSSYGSYEGVINFEMDICKDKGRKQIKSQIFINEKTIEQTEKMINYGLRKTANFVGSWEHLEGERVLLVSKIRRYALLNHLNNIPPPIDEVTARITIENLRCTLQTFEDSEHIGNHYYICILQQDTTVYSTIVASPNKLSWIDFGGCFIFDNVTNIFNIKIQLYCVNIPQRITTCSLCCFCQSSPRLPMAELVGEIYLGMPNINNKTFTFKDIRNFKTNQYTLGASIEISLNWPESLRGFLTMGTGRTDHLPMWNRRWCVLEEGKLKYYNYPSDETFSMLSGTIDFWSCKSCEEADLRHLNQKTLCLLLDDANFFKRIFISPDTSEGYRLWFRQLQIILKLVKDWSFLKKK